MWAREVKCGQVCLIWASLLSLHCDLNYKTDKCREGILHNCGVITMTNIYPQKDRHINTWGKKLNITSVLVVSSRYSRYLKEHISP